MADECPWSGMVDGEDAPAGFAEWAGPPARQEAPSPAAGGRAEASPLSAAAPLPGADLWSNWRPGGAAAVGDWERGGGAGGGWTPASAKSAGSWGSWGSWDRGRGRQNSSWGFGRGRWDEGEREQHAEAWRGYGAGPREEGARPSQRGGGYQGYEPDDPLEGLQGEWVDANHVSRSYSVRGNFCIVRRPEPPTYARFSLVVRDGKVWWGSLCKFVLEWQGDVAAWLALPGGRVSFRWLRGKGYHTSSRPAEYWRKAAVANSWRSWEEAPAGRAAPKAAAETYSAFSLEEGVAEEDTDEIDKTLDPFELPDKVWHSPPDDEATNVTTSWDGPGTASASSPATHASEAELESAARALWGQVQSASVSLSRPATHRQELRAPQTEGAPNDFGLVVKSFDPTEYGEDYMRLNEGDIVRFIKEEDGWYLGERVDKESLSIKLAEGWFPPAYTHFD